MIRSKIEARLSGAIAPDFPAGGVGFHLLPAGKDRLLLSDGIGRLEMRPPSERWDEGGLYAEFAALLPGAGKICADHPAVRAILSLRDRIAAGEWLGYGHLLPDPSGIHPALTLYPLTDGIGADIVLPFPDGRAIALWLVIPLTPDLLDFRLSADGAALWKRISGRPERLGWLD